MADGLAQDIVLSSPNASDDITLDYGDTAQANIVTFAPGGTTVTSQSFISAPDVAPNNGRITGNSEVIPKA